MFENRVIWENMIQISWNVLEGLNQVYYFNSGLTESSKQKVIPT